MLLFFLFCDRVAGADRAVWVPVLPGGRVGTVAVVAGEGWGSLAEVLCQSPESPHQWNIFWTFYVHPLLDFPLWHGACLLSLSKRQTPSDQNLCLYN